MKNTNLLILSLVLIFSSCITIETTSVGFKDEIYYTTEKYAEIAEQQEQQEQADQQKEESQEEYNEENYYDEFSSDDYYDYGYSARLRRFHGPAFGFGYYNNFYTNSFLYSGLPNHCGVSIYYGYNFWNPYYNDPFYFNNYAFGFSPMFYNPYGFSPYYQSQFYGYNNVLASNGYPSYYNSFDNNSIYYGPRNNNRNKTPESFANRYESEVKNRETQQTFLNKINERDKKPNYTIQQPNGLNNKRPTSLNQNDINSNNKVNSDFSKTNNPNFSKPVNTKLTSDKKPVYSKPAGNRKPTNYSKPEKQKKPFEFNKKPSRNNSYSKPSFNSSPRNSSPSRGGGSSGRRPRK